MPIPVRSLSSSSLGFAVICLIGAAAIAGCQGDDASSAPGDTEPTQVIQDASVAGTVAMFPYYGDLWVNTLTDDGRLLLAWGDGTGLADCVPTYDGVSPGAWTDWDYEEVEPDCFRVEDPCGTCVMEALFCDLFDCNACYPLCPFTPAGIMALDEGDVGGLPACEGESCIIARDIPTTDLQTARGRDDKPSSLLFAAGRLYLAGHQPSGSPTYGYIAVSDDYGETWTETPDSPWGSESPFRVMMFINMGRAYVLNTDGYVYGLGLPAEISTSSPQQLCLARVPVDSISSYDSYRYFTGSADAPTWSADPSAAVPLSGIETMAQGGAAYHEGAGRYLFLSGVNDWSTLEGALYEAEQPWGPWLKVADIPGGYIPSILNMEAGPDHLYFTKAGGAATYNLNIARIDLVIAR